MWESDFDKECRENPEMRCFIEQLGFATPLEPRDAFYGGRTEAYTLYKEAADDLEIYYFDVTSLYLHGLIRQEKYQWDTLKLSLKILKI